MTERRCEFCSFVLPLNHRTIVINGKRHELCHGHASVMFKRILEMAAQEGTEIHIVSRAKRKPLKVMEMREGRG